MEALSLLLSRVSLKFQILLVGIIGVAGLIAVGIAFYNASLTQAALQARLERVTAAESTLARVEIDLLETRRQEKNFQMRRDDAAVSQHAAQTQATVAAVDRLVGLVADPEIAARMQEAKAGFAGYGAAFAEYVGAQRTLGINETQGL